MYQSTFTVVAASLVVRILVHAPRTTNDLLKPITNQKKHQITNNMRTLAPTHARQLAISSQHLAAQRPSADRVGMMRIWRDLGCVQIDPIRAVERTDRLVLFSRLGPYNLADMDALLWQERSLFEYWAHAASMVLTEDYPIHNVQMRSYPQRHPNDMAWIEANHLMRDNIFARLRAEGPLSTGDFEDLIQVPWKSNGWNSERNVGMMLAFLWTAGELMICGREGNRRYWNIADHHLPPWTPRDLLEEEEMVTRAAQISLKALGVGTLIQIRKNFIRQRYPGLAQVLTNLQREGLVEEVQIVENGEPWPGPWYLHADRLPLLEQIQRGEWEGRTVLLSPFDNLICNRDRTELLFDFYYRIEIYVPKAKRQFGYYVLPILQGDRLIGRIDSQMDRKTGRYQINNVYAEAGVKRTFASGIAISNAISDLATFLGATEIVYTKNVPHGWKRALR